MATEGDNNARSDNTDRLSDLTDDLLHCIISFLPIGDAVRTSILSKRFRYCWIGTHVLKFDVVFHAKYIGFKRRQFYDVVGSVLSHNPGPVHELELLVPPRVADRQGMMPVTLPSQLHNRSYLTKLILKSCQLTCPPINLCGFRSLVNLNLVRVKVDGILLEAMICKSLRLKHLVLSDLDMIGSNTLVVDAHELRTLEYISSTSSLKLKYSPCLTSVTIHSKVELGIRESGISSLVQFFSLLPQLEKLKLGSVAINSLLDVTFSNQVQMVSLKSVARPETLLRAMHLIRTFLNVRELNLNTGEANFHASPGVDVGLWFDEEELLAEMEDVYSKLLNTGQCNMSLVTIREFCKAALTLWRTRNGTQP